MNKQQLFGVLRHLATTVGGALMMIDDDRYVAAGVILTAIGGGGSYLAKRPGKLRPLKVPSVVPLFLASAMGVVVMGFSGCASVPAGEAPTKAELAAAITQPVTKNLCLPLLQKNPQLEPALLAVAQGIDLVFAQGKLEPEQLRSFIDSLGATFPQLDERDKLVLGSAIWDAYTIYTEITGQRIVDVTDPTAVALLDAFKSGILEGIQFFHAFKDPAGAPETLPKNAKTDGDPMESEAPAGMVVTPAGAPSRLAPLGTVTAFSW